MESNMVIDDMVIDVNGNVFFRDVNRKGFFQDVNGNPFVRNVDNTFRPAVVNNDNTLSKRNVGSRGNYNKRTREELDERKAERAAKRRALADNATQQEPSSQAEAAAENSQPTKTSQVWASSDNTTAGQEPRLPLQPVAANSQTFGFSSSAPQLAEQFGQPHYNSALEYSAPDIVPFSQGTNSDFLVAPSQATDPNTFVPFSQGTNFDSWGAPSQATNPNFYVPTTQGTYVNYSPTPWWWQFLGQGPTAFAPATTGAFEHFVPMTQGTQYNMPPNYSGEQNLGRWPININLLDTSNVAVAPQQWGMFFACPAPADQDTGLPQFVPGHYGTIDRSLVPVDQGVVDDEGVVNDEGVVDGVVEDDVVFENEDVLEDEDSSESHRDFSDLVDYEGDMHPDNIARLVGYIAADDSDFSFPVSEPDQAGDEPSSWAQLGNSDIFF